MLRNKRWADGRWHAAGQHADSGCPATGRRNTSFEPQFMQKKSPGSTECPQLGQKAGCSGTDGTASAGSAATGIGMVSSTGSGAAVGAAASGSGCDLAGTPTDFFALGFTTILSVTAWSSKSWPAKSWFPSRSGENQSGVGDDTGLETGVDE